jgi:hypothetical protein
MPAPTPDCNVNELAFELKKFLDLKKIDLVNPTCPDIQCFPPPDDDEYPETKKFSEQMANFFSFVDEALVDADEAEAIAKIGEDGEWSKPFDDIMAQASKLIYEDPEFWPRIRETVIVLYKPTKVIKNSDGEMIFLPDPTPSPWDLRWKKVKVWYDPDDLPITVVRKMVNKNTGEVVTSDIFEEKIQPGGLVIDIL